MEIFIEIVGMMIETFAFSAEDKNQPRKVRLIGFSIIFILMGLFFFLAYILRYNTFMMSFLIILGLIMALTLLNSLADIIRLIRNEESND